MNQGEEKPPESASTEGHHRSSNFNTTLAVVPSPDAELLTALELGKELGERFRLRDSLMPCIAVAIKDGAGKGTRNDFLYLAAVELRRCGADTQERLTELLSDINRKSCRPPEAPSKIQSTVKSALLPGSDGRPKVFMCTGIRKWGYCLVADAQEVCPWNTFRAARRKHRPEHEFWLYCELWEASLAYSELRLLRALLKWEQQRKLKPGTEFIARYRDLARLVNNMSIARIGEAAAKLAERGLIHFKPGEPGNAALKSETASSWHRVLPVPHPNKLQRFPRPPP